MNMTKVSWIIAVFLIGGSVVFVYSRIEDRPTDPGHYWQINEQVIQRHATVFRAYREVHGSWPDDLAALRRFSKELEPGLELGWASAAAAGGGVYRYQKPTGADPQQVIFAGSKQLLADSNVEARPAGYLVLMANLTTAVLSEDAHTQRAAFARPQED